MSKLEEPTSGKSNGKSSKPFTVTPQGVSLQKGEEIGMFDMGSTIALIFECPPDYQIELKEGDQVKLGDKLLVRK